MVDCKGPPISQRLKSRVEREGCSPTKGAMAKVSSMPFQKEHDLFVSLNKQAGKRAGLPESGISVSSAGLCFSYFAPGLIVHRSVK